MNYSVYTRGKNNDYRWSLPSDEQISEYLNGYGFAVFRSADGTFSVYFVSESSDKLDYQQRPIGIGVLFSGCTESKAKGLAVWGLEHFGNYATELSKCVTNFGQDEWEVNTKVIEHFVDCITEIPVTDHQLTICYEDIETSANRTILAEEIRNSDWTWRPGFKLLVDNGLLSGEKLEIVRQQVDQYLFKGAVRREWSVKQPPKSLQQRFRDFLLTFDTAWILPIVYCFIGCVLLLTFNNIELWQRLIIVYFIGGVLLFWYQQLQIKILQEQIKTKNLVIADWEKKDNNLCKKIQEQQAHS
ncbi:MAG: hypothetical protein LBF88_02975 [Planctomycetaceae bacterium]|jgi:hypothetical protein|nr:hypothetical protein [Planctomycetaceae bacterium]